MRVLIIVPNFYQAIGIMGLNIVKACPSIDFYLFKSHDLLKRKKDFLKLTQNVDIVHWLSNVSRLPLDFEDLIKEIPCPTVGTVHHVIPGEEDKVETASLCDVIHVESDIWLREITKITGKPVVLAHQPIDLTRHLKLNLNTISNKPYRVGTFGFVDSLSGRKRIDILLESLKIVKSKDVPIELVVQGPNWDHLIPFFTQAEIPVKNLGFASAKNAWKAYGEIDIYVCSSDVEGGPLTVIEALASHLPVVSTRVGVVPELLSNGSGVIVDKNNPSQLADAIECILTNPEKYLYHKIKTEEAILRFSHENISEEYKFLYNSTISSWEKTRSKQWKMIENQYIDPKIQRGSELIFDRIINTPFLKSHPGKPRHMLDKVISKLLYPDAYQSQGGCRLYF